MANDASSCGVPPALSTTLSLDLPKEQRPTVSGDALLTGPFPVADDPSQSNWRFWFGGRPRLEFAIRSSGGGSVSSAASLAARYEIAPGQLACTFEYDLRPAKGTVAEWQFDVDAGVRITDVVANNRASWAVDGPIAPGSPYRLHVHLNQPGTGGKVLISALAPIPNPFRPTDAPLPMVRPVNALIDEETLEIRIAPELKLERWTFRRLSPHRLAVPSRPGARTSLPRHNAAGR